MSCIRNSIQLNNTAWPSSGLLWYYLYLIMQRWMFHTIIRRGISRQAHHWILCTKNMNDLSTAQLIKLLNNFLVSWAYVHQSAEFNLSYFNFKFNNYLQFGPANGLLPQASPQNSISFSFLVSYSTNTLTIS